MNWRVIFILLLFSLGSCSWEEESTSMSAKEEEIPGSKFGNEKKSGLQDKALVSKNKIIDRGGVDFFNGTRTEWYEDGEKQEQSEYLEGKKNGVFKRWYPNGQIEREGTMVDDRWSGDYWEWYENGQLRVSGKYLDGKREGEWTFFQEEGGSLPPILFRSGEEVTRELPSLFR